MATEFGAVLRPPHLLLTPDASSGGQVVLDTNTFDVLAFKTVSGFSSAKAKSRHTVKKTADATPATFQATDACPAGGAIIVSALIVAKKDSGVDVSAYVVEAAASRNGSGNLTLIGSVVQRVIGETTGTSDGTVAVDTTNQWFNFSVTGVAASNYVWSCSSTFVIVDGTQTA